MVNEIVFRGRQGCKLKMKFFFLGKNLIQTTIFNYKKIETVRDFS